MQKYKLSIDLLPMGAWGNDLSITLPKKYWDLIREDCYKKANKHCEICGEYTDDLHAHEIWQFDIVDQTQTLQDIVGICNKCHGVIHFRNSQINGYGENAKRHFMIVNGASELDFASHLSEALIVFDQRNKVYRWNMIVDLNKFGVEDYNYIQPYRARIVSQYDDNELEKLINNDDLTPNLLKLDVNNYIGQISIDCGNTNRIEWYNEKGELLDKKFNFTKVFHTKFNVKNLLFNGIYFKILNNYGNYTSKVFNLIDFNSK